MGITIIRSFMGNRIKVAVIQTGPEQWEAFQSDSIRTLVTGNSYQDVLSRLEERRILPLV